MGKFLDYENPVLNFLSRLADLIVLNLLIIATSLPLITIGASFTAAHYTALKLRRGESYVVKSFWKSFKENFKQSTIIWLIFVVYVVVAYLAFITLSTGEAAGVSTMQGVLLAAFVFSICFMLWVFPLQSKFVNPIGKTMKNAFFMTFKHIFRTVLMLVISLFPFALSLQLYSVLLLFGFSLPIYISAIIYNKPFEKMEKLVLESLGQTGDAS